MTTTNVTNGTLCNTTLDLQNEEFLNVLIFVEASTSVLVVTGNFFVIALIQKKKLLGRSTNVFVFSIAIADFLNGSLSIPTHALSLVYGDATTKVFLCKGYRFIMYLTKTVVPYTIIFMTGEKVMRILCPTREIVTVARCMFFTSLLWFFSAAFNIWCVVLYTVETVPVGNFSNEEEYTKHTEAIIGAFDKHQCILNVRFEGLHPAFLTVDLFVLFIIPLLCVLCFYTVLIVKYFTILRERILTYFYVIKLVMALSLNVFVTHLPLEILTFYDNMEHNPSHVARYMTHIVTCVYFTRGIWNVLIYGYFKHYVCRKRHMASIRAASSSTDNKFKLKVPSLKGRRCVKKETI